MLYPTLPNHTEKVTTMRYRTPVLAAVLMLVAPSAHAFTFGNGNQGSTGSSYGGSLTSPGSSLASPGGAPGGTLATPEDQAKNFGSGTGSQDGGLSFRFGSGPLGSNSSQRLAPPAWSNNPLYLERGSSQ
jgi:hypothetical protein